MVFSVQVGSFANEQRVAYQEGVFSTLTMDRSLLLFFSFSSCLSGRDTEVVRAQSASRGQMRHHRWPGLRKHFCFTLPHCNETSRLPGTLHTWH